MTNRNQAEDAIKQQAAQDFVRSVLVSSFRQNADEATIKGVAQKVLTALSESPTDKQHID